MRKAKQKQKERRGQERRGQERPKPGNEKQGEPAENKKKLAAIFDTDSLSKVLSTFAFFCPGYGAPHGRGRQEGFFTIAW